MQSQCLGNSKSNGTVVQAKKLSIVLCLSLGSSLNMEKKCSDIFLFNCLRKFSCLRNSKESRIRMETPHVGILIRSLTRLSWQIVEESYGGWKDDNFFSPFVYRSFRIRPFTEAFVYIQVSSIPNDFSDLYTLYQILFSNNVYAPGIPWMILGFSEQQTRSLAFISRARTTMTPLSRDEKETCERARVALGVRPCVNYNLLGNKVLPGWYSTRQGWKGEAEFLWHVVAM